MKFEIYRREAGRGTGSGAQYAKVGSFHVPGPNAPTPDKMAEEVVGYVMHPGEILVVGENVGYVIDVQPREFEGKAR